MNNASPPPIFTFCKGIIRFAVPLFLVYIVNMVDITMLIDIELTSCLHIHRFSFIVFSVSEKEISAQCKQRELNFGLTLYTLRFSHWWRCLRKKNVGNVDGVHLMFFWNRWHCNIDDVSAKEMSEVKFQHCQSSDVDNANAVYVTEI